MASLSLKHIYKVFDGTTKAVNDFNMEIRDKEFIVFVGPSGCGKSTTLRMIAGLEDITAGELRIDNVIVNDMEPRDRNIAMVFQNYALYPHMTVYENMAFSLQTAHMPKAEIRKKVMEAAEILGITEYLERKPRALSGGQRQRVALGRAIVRNPKVFLFDEPLSNLDAKLRATMRAEIIRLYERLGTTFIYVTHDQVEAMTMGSRIVVMRGGVVQQIDTPKNLYNHPANLFVAGFIGTPRMNFWNATLLKEEGGQRVLIRLSVGATLDADYAHLYRVQPRYMDGAHPIVLGIRPDDVRPYEEGLGNEYAPLDMTVTVVEALGGETLIYGRLDGAEDAPIGSEAASGELILKAPAECEVQRGDRMRVAIRLDKLHVFDRESEQSLCPHIPQENVCPCTISDNVLTFAGQRFPLPPALCNSPEEQAPAQKKPREGLLTLPTEAILLGTGSGRAHVEETETIVDTEQGRSILLYRLTVGNSVLFAKEPPNAESPTPRFHVGDTLPFDVDFTRISAPEIHPLPAINQLHGLFTKEKTVDDRAGSPTRGKRIYRFHLDMGGRAVEAEAGLREKLFSCKGSGIFRTALIYSFPISAARMVTAAVEGLSGIVKAVMDYGRAGFARVSVGGQEMIVPIGDTAPTVGSTVSVALDQSRLTVTDREAGIVIA